MTPDAVTDVPTDSFCELPHTVTVPMASRIKSVRDVLESGGYAGHVTAALVGVGIYPVDGLDVLSAYRESGRGTVPCIVVDAESLAEAQLLHVRRSAHGQVNPIVFADAVSFVRRHMGDGPAAEIENREYERIAGLPLAPGIRERVSEYITGLGKRIERIPSFFLALQAISEMEPGLQSGALDRLTKYCDRRAGVYAVPDRLKLKRMFAPKKERKEPATSRDTAEEDAVKVMITNEPLGCYHSYDTNSVCFWCDCGSEYVFSAKGMDIRELKDRSSLVPLYGDRGIRRYAMPEGAAKYLVLSLQPAVYYYELSGKKHGTTILISKKIQSDDAIRRVRRALRPPRKRAAWHK